MIERKEIRRAGKEGDQEERKEIRRTCGKGRRSGGRAGKEGDREDVRERKEIGRAVGTDGAECVWQFCNLPHGCHLHISFIENFMKKH